MSIRSMGAILLVALGLAACGGDGGAATRTAEANLALGQRLYEANCAACHGVNGEGEPNWQQPDAAGRYPAPPHDGSGHTWHHADPLLLQIIAEGGQSPGSRMPAYGDQLTDAEMVAILDYIKTFWSPEQRAMQADMTRRAP